MITHIKSVTAIPEHEMPMVNKLSQEQEEYANSILNNHITFVDSKAGTGKALANNTPVKTPTGDVDISNLKVGDRVFNTYGGVSNVLGVYPQGKKRVYEVEFSDGTIIECCSEHLWEIQTANERFAGTFKVLTTEEILNRGLRTSLNSKNPRWNAYVPDTKAVPYDKRTYTLPPYVIGALLGDGGLTGGSVKFINTEDDVIAKVNKGLANINHKLVHNGSKTSTINYIAVYTKPDGKKVNVSALRLELERLQLMGTTSATKFIPKEYLYGDVASRIELLNGLIDTDGESTKSSYVYSTVSPQLASDIQELVNSLGGTCKISLRQTYYTYNNEKKAGKVSYRLYIKAPKDTPKLHSSIKHEGTWAKGQSSSRRTIRRIEATDRYEEMTCISVDSTNKLFLITNFIATHNTTIATLVGMALLKRNMVDKVVYVANPVQQDTLGHLKGGLVDKILPYMTPFTDALYGAGGVSRQLINLEAICDPTVETMYEATTPTFLRGANIKRSFVIIDEAQNYSAHELKKIGTRLDDDCILVVIGHSNQMDVKFTESGFLEYQSHFKRLKEMGAFKKVGFCELTHNFRGKISQAFDEL